MAIESNTFRKILVTIVIVLLHFGCQPQTKKPILHVNELQLSEIAIDGLKYTWTLSALKEELDAPVEIIESNPTTKLILYEKNSIGIVDGKLNMLSGKRLRLSGVLVEDNIKFQDFASLYGLPKAAVQGVNSATRSYVVKLKDGYLKLTLAKKRIIGYMVYKEP